MAYGFSLRDFVNAAGAHKVWLAHPILVSVLEMAVEIYTFRELFRIKLQIDWRFDWRRICFFTTQLAQSLKTPFSFASKLAIAWR